MQRLAFPPIYSFSTFRVARSNVFAYEWWQQLLVAIGGGLVGGASAVVATIGVDMKQGKLDHLKDSEIEFFANVWFAAHYWDKVWPRVEELADIMSTELEA